MNNAVDRNPFLPLALLAQKLADDQPPHAMGDKRNRFASFKIIENFLQPLGAGLYALACTRITDGDSIVSIIDQRLLHGRKRLGRPRNSVDKKNQMIAGGNNPIAHPYRVESIFAGSVFAPGAPDIIWIEKATETRQDVFLNAPLCIDVCVHPDLFAAQGRHGNVG